MGTTGNAVPLAATPFETAATRPPQGEGLLASLMLRSGAQRRVSKQMADGTRGATGIRTPCVLGIL